MTLKSCASCPSFVSTAEGLTLFQKPPMADVCSRHGRVLSRPGHDDLSERICQSVASECDDHGAPREVQVTLNMRIGNGDPDAIIQTPNGKPNVCTTCEHFVPASVVEQELGWMMPMCAAKGRLLFANRLAAEAGECGVGSVGPVRSTTDGVRVATVYVNGTVKTSAATSKAASYNLSDELARHAIDPRQYVTDKPVSPEDQEAGIRAWRQVNDPKEKFPPLFLPIFDGVKLCGYDPRVTYEGDPELYVDYQGLLYKMTFLWYYKQRTPLLIGEAGVGKTQLLFWMGWLMDLPVIKHEIHPQMEAWEFSGKDKLYTDANGTQITGFDEGRFTSNFDKPCIQAVDELNMNEECATFLRPTLGGSQWLIMNQAAGLMKERHPWMFLACTQNPADNPIYVGTKPLSAAEMRRLCPIAMGLPDENIERHIMRAACHKEDYAIDERIIDKIMQISTTIREMIADGSLPISWGVSETVKVASLTEGFDLEDAFKLAVIDGLESSVVDLVLQNVRSVA